MELGIVGAATAGEVMRGQERGVGLLAQVVLKELAVFQVDVDGRFGHCAALGDDATQGFAPLVRREIVLHWTRQLFVPDIYVRHTNLLAVC